MASADMQPAAATTNPWLPQPWRVASVRRELDDVTTLTLTPPEGVQTGFEAGQFNMLYAFGVGEVAISISGVEDGGYVHTVRAVGAVSRALAGSAPGDTVGLRGPFGSAWPVERAAGADVVFVAGGLGLAPLRPAIRSALAERDRYGRVSVLVGSRHPADILFQEELAQWRQRLDVDIDITVDHADADWHGNVGVVTTLIDRAAFDPVETVAMICGPEIMMRFAAVALCDAGVEPERICLSLERNMKCAIGLCGHCQFGPAFICRDGPVLRYADVSGQLTVAEL